MKKLTQEQFIEKAIEIHGDLYGYDRCVYIDAKERVEIYCKIHKEYFWQTPDTHMRNSGCPKCGLIKRSESRTDTTEQFIEKAIKKHGNKFRYDKTIYVKSNKEVQIYCKKHRFYFNQRPNDHLNSYGCPKCGLENSINNSKKTSEWFIKEAIKKHGDLYGYDKTTYVNCTINVKIYCKKCKEYFWQKSNVHLSGCGCPYCAGHKLKTTEQFIEKAIKKHRNNFRYDKVCYTSCKKTVDIYCNKCNKYFKQSPNSHLRGNGCPYCTGRYKTTKEFIKEAKKVHGGTYDYSKSKYTQAIINVEIICSVHGSFWQNPHNHIMGKQGCPKCKKSKGEIEINRVLDINKIKHIQEKRFVDCRHKNPLPFDFYLPDYNICIEYQGEQHYNLVNFGGHITEEKQKENLKKVQHNDQTKRTYCKTNQIRLIEIPYWDISNIDQILTTELL